MLYLSFSCFAKTYPSCVSCKSSRGSRVSSIVGGATRFVVTGRMTTSMTWTLGLIGPTPGQEWWVSDPLRPVQYSEGMRRRSEHFTPIFVSGVTCNSCWDVYFGNRVEDRVPFVGIFTNHFYHNPWKTRIKTVDSSGLLRPTTTFESLPFPVQFDFVPKWTRMSPPRPLRSSDVIRSGSVSRPGLSTFVLRLDALRHLKRTKFIKYSEYKKSSVQYSPKN